MFGGVCVGAALLYGFLIDGYGPPHHFCHAELTGQLGTSASGKRMAVECVQARAVKVEGFR